jgi:hypothetical protein
MLQSVWACRGCELRNELFFVKDKIYFESKKCEFCAFSPILETADIRWHLYY